MGQIKRGEANMTLDTLIKIANVPDLTLGSLIVPVEQTSSN